MNIQSLCVYCGSSLGRNGVYGRAARDLARALVERGIRLVYGGASVGVMGAIADEVLRLGGRAIGVIPEALERKELAHQHLTEINVTSSMHERKSLMADLSDGFVALPGGIGTLEEIFEAWTWGQLGLHRKPCGLLNIGGYFEELSAFLDHALDEEFISEPHRRMLVVADTPDALLDRFEAYAPPVVTKWIERGET